MGNPMVVEVVKVACDIVDGNPHGFYECNADAVPKGAKLYSEKPAKQPKQPKKNLENFVENEVIPAIKDAQSRGVK